MQFKIVCARYISGKAGDTVTLYKNTKNLYVAILKGVEVGLASEVISEKEEPLPTCIDCVVIADFQNRLQFMVKQIEDA